MEQPYDGHAAVSETIRAAADQLNSAVLACDARAAVVVFNVEAEHILRVPRDRVLGHHLGELMRETRGPLSPLCRVLLDTLESGEQYRRQELILSEEYTPAVLGYTTSVLFDATDEPAGAVVLFADLSEEKARLLEAQHAQQLTQLTRLASQIAHDVKNPLTAIQLQAESLARHPDPAVVAASRAITAEVAQCRERLEAVRRGLVPASGHEAPAPYCDLAGVISDLAERATLWGQARISTQATGGRCFVPLDRGSAESLISYLLTYFITDSGDVTDSGDPTAISIDLAYAEGAVTLVLDAADIRHSSMRHHQSTGSSQALREPDGREAPSAASVGAAGLGLWVARRIAARSDGHVAVEQRGETACIRVSLPHLTAHRVKGLSILVVDDEPTLRRLVSRLLVASGAHPVEAADGREALEAFGKHTVDAVVMDSLMPVMDGFELLAALPASLPVVMVSGTGDSRKRAEAHWRKGLAFLSKPFSSEELVVALAYLMWEAGR